MNGRPMPARAARSWVRLTAVTLGVTAVGMVAGAAIAAPDELLPMARAMADTIATRTGPMLVAAFDGTLAFGRNTGAALAARSPRELAMMGAGLLALMLGVAAVLQARRSRRAERPMGRPVPLITPLPSMPRRTPARSATPRQVRALAEQGTSLSDIARRTGLPLDAISMLLSVSDPARQLPPTTA